MNIKNSAIFFMMMSMISYVHACYDQQSADSVFNIVDNQKRPSPLFQELLNLLDIHPQDDSFKSLVDLTQQQWLRAEGKERKQLTEQIKDQEKKDKILSLMRGLGCISELHALHNEYDAAVVYGGSFQRMRARIEYLIAEHNRGIAFKSVVFLFGQRPLTKELDEDAQQLIYNGRNLATESDALYYLVASMQFPEEFKDIKKIFVDVPMQEEKGTLVRPNTLHTIIAWLATKPELKTCLCISSQPYACYQHALAKKYLPRHWYIETIGSKASSDTVIPDYLDNLTRTLYNY